ncbi:MAG: histone deacetylase [Actinomycetota bacterium]
MSPPAAPLEDDELVWYASYGSNCLGERFAAYLTGGRAPGASTDERGARDPSPPLASAAMWFPRPARFAGDSAKWGSGGVAFLDHAGDGSAPGRRYLVTKGQFDDVTAQENRRETVPLPLHDLEIGEVRVIGEGFYGGLLALAPVDGIPVVTFTSPHPIVPRPVNPPSAAYLGTIIRGLLQVHDVPADELGAALHRCPGVADGWTPETIAALA